MKKVKLVNENYMNEMSNFELSRWAALVEGVNIIADKADERVKHGVKKFNKMSIKQPALRKYIESTCDAICRTFNAKDAKEESQRAERAKGI